MPPHNHLEQGDPNHFVPVSGPRTQIRLCHPRLKTLRGFPSHSRGEPGFLSQRALGLGAPHPPSTPATRPASCLSSQGHCSSLATFSSFPHAQNGSVLPIGAFFLPCMPPAPRTGVLLPSAMHSRWEPARWGWGSRHTALSTPVRGRCSVLSTGQKHRGHRDRHWEGAPGISWTPRCLPLPSTPSCGPGGPRLPSEKRLADGGTGRQKAGGLPLTRPAPPRPEGRPDTSDYCPACLALLSCRLQGELSAFMPEHVPVPEFWPPWKRGPAQQPQRCAAPGASGGVGGPPGHRSGPSLPCFPQGTRESPNARS